MAQLAASLPALEEIKVEECRRVGPTLRMTVAAHRAATAPAREPSAHLIVRYGALECSSASKPAAD